MNSGKQSNECAESEFQIIFIHSGKQYDKKYLQSKYFPEILTKYNMHSEPYKTKDAGKIVGLSLIKNVLILILLLDLICMFVWNLKTTKSN